jgi:hypothetical protein
MVGYTDRRSHPRAGFSGITLVRDGVQEIPCIAGNLSESGILLYPQRRYDEPDRAFQVTFTLPRASRWINLRGRLVRQNQLKRRIEWGVEFTDVSPEVQDLLREYVHTRVVGVEEPTPIPTSPEIEIPLPPPRPQPQRRQRTTAPLRPLRSNPAPESTQETLEQIEIEIEVEQTGEEEELDSGSITARVDTNTPTLSTLRDELGDIGANDLPTVMIPRERGPGPGSDDPTRTASSREAAALRERCRRN